MNIGPQHLIAARNSRKQISIMCSRSDYKINLSWYCIQMTLMFIIMFACWHLQIIFHLSSRFTLWFSYERDDNLLAFLQRHFLSHLCMFVIFWIRLFILFHSRCQTLFSSLHNLLINYVAETDFCGAISKRLSGSRGSSRSNEMQIYLHKKEAKIVIENYSSVENYSSRRKGKISFVPYLVESIFIQSELLSIR